jgi:hypothetical protein
MLARYSKVLEQVTAALLKRSQKVKAPTSIAPLFFSPTPLFISSLSSCHFQRLVLSAAVKVDRWCTLVWSTAKANRASVGRCLLPMLALV